MVRLIEDNKGEIERLCEKHAVKQLELFGSAAGGDFDPQDSDIDFLVEFLPLGPGEYADAYFGLLEELEDLFGRSVDLVMVSAVKNQYFLEAIRRNRTVLYAA